MILVNLLISWYKCQQTLQKCYKPKLYAATKSAKRKYQLITSYQCKSLATLSKTKWRFILSLLGFLLPCSFQSAHSISDTSHFTNISNVIQDQRGFIWLSGQQGLTRFDSSHAINFNKNDKNWPLTFTWTNDISNANNNILVATKSHSLWLVNPKTAEEHSLIIPYADKTIYHAVYFNNQYYFDNAENIYRYDPFTKQSHLLKENMALVEFLPTKNSLYFRTTTHIYRIEDDSVYSVLAKKVMVSATTDKAIIFATSTNGKHELHSFINQNSHQVIKLTSPVRAITKEYGTSNFFTVNSYGMINKFSNELIKLHHDYPVSQQSMPRKIYHDSSNALWLISSAGVEILSNSQNINYPREFNTEISGIKLAKINGQLLLGSQGEGLENFNTPTSDRIKKINGLFSTNGKRINDMSTVGKDLYIATYDGLWRYQQTKNQLDKIPLSSKTEVLLKITQHNNLLYIATDGGGFIIYDIDKQEQTFHAGKTKAFSSADITDILPITNNIIWLATGSGIDVFDIQSQTIKQLNIESSAKVISLTTANNKLYAATKDNGILVFNSNETLLSRIGVGISFGDIGTFNNNVLAPSRRGLYQVNTKTDEITLIPSTDKYSFTSKPIELNNKVYIGHYGGILQIPLVLPKQFHPKIYISKTTVMGKAFIENKLINVSSSNDVITLNFASLDYRSGQEKQFKYQINGERWQDVNGDQLTLTGLAAGEYRIVIKGTNSLGQWSRYHAYADIMVAYPWYWTPQLRIVLAVLALALILIIAWLVYLRGRSIKLVHHLLSKDINNKEQAAIKVQRQLKQAIKLLDDIPAEKFHEHDIKIKLLLSNSIKEIYSVNKTKEPNNIFGEKLSVALPYLYNFFQQTYQVSIRQKLDINESNIDDEMQAALYKIIYEALSSAIYNGNSQNFTVIIKEYEHKLWLSISDDNSSFANFNNKMNFDMAMYYIRQVAKKYSATIHTFDEQEKGSQLAISMPFVEIPLDNSENNAEY